VTVTGRQPEDQNQEQPAADEPTGNTLQDASDEAVRALEEGDEPGHGGRGDYG
jgi:hypothetical protein